MTTILKRPVLPMRIPLSNGYLVISRHEFGDPNSLTMQLPKTANGKVHLPRHLFGEEIRSYFDLQERLSNLDEADR